jgi:hypothetical protein
MALRLDPVRLLIADDVGIGKTIEALLVARELLDRGEIRRLAVLCPPHLAEQWQGEMVSKFHIDAELVLPSTVRRLERHCRFDESLFERFPYVVISTDFIKTDRRRADFLRACPEFVIVDEVHTCAPGFGPGSARHQRHELIAGLSADPDRHLVLVTATPHSGKEEAFRTLIGLLGSDLADLPADLSGSTNKNSREKLARHFVQRRRADIRHFLDEDTSFPDRLEREATWALTNDYRHLFERVLDWARETVRDPSGGLHRQRVRWWSALALLRALGSSPAAAEATLRTRASAADTSTPEEADEVGRLTVLDLDDSEAAERMDVAPGADPGEDGGADAAEARRLRDLARAAAALAGDSDPKLATLVPLVQELLDDDYSPILFCRFIPTATYLAEELRQRLAGQVEVFAVTGLLPPAEREARVRTLGGSPKRVLVATDCLSEGVNLQRWFDSVIHYDLAWSPTRHEQREGRADRFGQDRDEVRVITYYGVDNQIDGIVLDVLLRKHRRIRKATGVAVPVPGDSSQLVEAIFEGLLLREQAGGVQEFLPGFEELLRPKLEELHGEWESASEREKRSRTLFAQERLKPDEVLPELAAVRDALGGRPDIERFLREAVTSFGGVVSGSDPVRIDLGGASSQVRDLVGGRVNINGRFELPVEDDEEHLNRTHPFVERLSAYLLDAALEPESESVARRCAAIRTDDVERRTTLLLLRYRFQIRESSDFRDGTMLAEDARLLAFRGAPEEAEWLPANDAEALLRAEPSGNIDPEQARDFVARVIAGRDQLRPQFDEEGRRRADELLEAHKRVRAAAGRTGVRYAVEAKLPPDLLGVYIYLPSSS